MMDNPTQSYEPEIDVETVHGLLRAGDEEILMVDCREPEELQIACLNGAIRIPMAETPNRVDELESHREKRIVIFCHHGMRSLQVTQWLRERGFHGAQSMRGGIDAWSVSIDRNVPRY